MEKYIAEKVEELITENNPDNEEINEFIKAIEEYNKLIEQGLVKERGFNILTTEEIYLFNSKNAYCQTPG